MPSSQTTVHTISVDGVGVFYRTAGSLSSPSILLLHGFPSSSHQYRKLIPLLAQKYRVLAPDIPGFGFTKAPAEYKYTFDNFARTISGFVDALEIKKFAMHVFDYGAPTGYRIAVQRPEAVTAIISQNGNAYLEGFGEEFWAPLKEYWASGSDNERDVLRRHAFSIESIKFQYECGTPDDRKQNIGPESYALDHALLTTPTAIERQLDILYDYRTNLDAYPSFQEYFRRGQVPLLAIWGENNIIFIPPGADAFRKDLPNAKIVMLGAGHFAVETPAEEIAGEMLEFLRKVQFGSP